MTLIWHGAARAEEVVNLGPLALIQPLLEKQQTPNKLLSRIGS